MKKGFAGFGKTRLVASAAFSSPSSSPSSSLFAVFVVVAISLGGLKLVSASTMPNILLVVALSGVELGKNTIMPNVCGGT